MKMPDTSLIFAVLAAVFIVLSLSPRAKARSPARRTWLRLGILFGGLAIFLQFLKTRPR